MPDSGATRVASARPLELGTDPAGDVVAIPWPESAGRHLLILGETGMGKSSLLVNLALKAVARRASLVLLDPLGDTAQEFVERLGPRKAGRVLWISPHHSPIGVNVLQPGRVAVSSLGVRERFVGELVSALRRVRLHRYPGTAFWGPRIEETLRLALNTARALPQGTLVDAERLLQPETRLSGAVPPELRAEVDEFRAWVRQRPEEVEGARRVLGEITRNPTLRRMLCEPAPRWSPESIVLPSAITVVSGDATQVGETNSRYLLAVHLAVIWPMILSRASPDKLVVALDEVQWYAHESLAEMMRLGRRFNVHVWAATQSLHSLTDDAREAFLTNAADLVAFRGSPDEARELSRWSTSVAAEELLALPQGWGLAMVGKGARVETIRTPPLRPVTAGETRFRDAIEHSRRFVCPAPGDTEGPAPSIEVGMKGGGRDIDPSTARVLAVLRAGAVAYPDRGELRVRLSALRAVVDPSGLGVRYAGSTLQRSGCLKAVERSGGETWWRLDCRALTESARGSPESLAPGDATRLWREVDGYEGNSGIRPDPG